MEGSGSVWLGVAGWFLKADPSLTTPKLKKTLGAPCAQDDSCGLVSRALGMTAAGGVPCAARMTAVLRKTLDAPNWGGVYLRVKSGRTDDSQYFQTPD